MKLVIDYRETDITYVDKTNLQYADNNNVCKIVNTGSTNIIKDIVKILGSARDLSREAINVLYVINTQDSYTTIAEMFDIYKAITYKSRSTFDRGISELKKKGIIKININNQILLSKDYNCRNMNPKFIIIELNPKDTSAGLNI